MADDYQLLAIDDPKVISISEETGEGQPMVSARTAKEKMVRGVLATLRAFRAKHLPVAEEKLVALATAIQLEKQDRRPFQS